MKRSGPLLLWTLIIGGGLAGCPATPDDLVARHTFDHSVENGITVAHSSAIPRYEGELFAYERVVVLKEDEREESLFVRGEPPYIDENGYFYMADNSPSDFPSTSCIMVYDPNGVFQFSFGKPGYGPGDMIHPRILRVGDGRLLTYDPYQRRFSLYTTDGGLLEINSLPSWKGVGWVASCYHAPGDRYIVPARRRTEREDDSTTLRSAVTVFGAEWDTVCTIIGEELPATIRGISSTVGEMTIGSSVSVPFGPRPLAVYSEHHGILMTSGVRPEIDLFDLDGIRRAKLTIDLPPRVVTDEDRQLHEAPIRKNLTEGRPEFRNLYRAELEALEYPEHMRYWSDLEVDDSGFIWLEIPGYVTAFEHGEDAVLYHVLSPEGEYLGITRLPTHRRGRTRLTKGFLTVVEMDEETGEKEIVAYRISPAVPGFVYPWSSAGNPDCQ
jgi:hypothetical protein